MHILSDAQLCRFLIERHPDAYGELVARYLDYAYLVIWRPLRNRLDDTTITDLAWGVLSVVQNDFARGINPNHITENTLRESVRRVAGKFVYYIWKSDFES